MSRYTEVQWKEWQGDILSLLQTDPDWRTVYWYWEVEGNVGKSFLATYIYLHYPTIICQGKSGDVVHQIAKYIEEEKKNPQVLIYDIPRTNEQYVSYALMERIKNGLVFDGKYETARLLLPPIHVIVFANFPPDQTKMSEDRWFTFKIEQ